MASTEAGHEVELKLLADSSAALRAVAQRDSLGTFRLRRRGVENLETTYLDTPQHTLLANAIALRLRRHRRSWEATAKWSGQVAGGVHTRREINVPLPSAPALPFALPAGELHDELFAYVLGRPLRPVLVTRIRRQLFDLLDENNLVAAELALDTVRHGRDAKQLQAPYYEVEVEQRAASVDELRAIAGLLSAEHALRPTAESKFQRAQRGVLRRPAPRRETTIVASDDWLAAARKIASAQLTRLRVQDPRLRRAGDPHPEAIHQMRVATRRLRTMFQLFADAIDAATQRRLASELKWLGTTLGAARDLDVQVAQLRATLPPGTAERPAVADFFHHLGAARAPALLDLRTVLSSPRYARLLRNLERFSTPPARRRSADPVPATVSAAAAAAIEKAQRAVRKRAKRAISQFDARPFHELRIRCRRLRYLLEFLAPVLGDEADWTIARMTLIQDLLGEANDRVILARQLRQHAGTESTLDDEQRTALLATADDLLLAAGALHERFRTKWDEDAARIRKRVGRITAKLRKGGQTS